MRSAALVLAPRFRVCARGDSQAAVKYGSRHVKPFTRFVDQVRVDGYRRMLEDPVDVLFGVQLGGGTDINRALAYCEGLIRQPLKTHMILISDLAEGGDRDQLLARAASLVESGVNLIVLLALSDDGRSWHDEANAKAFAALGCPVFACTPDQFPELMAAALRSQDVGAWAAERDIALVRS